MMVFERLTAAQLQLLLPHCSPEPLHETPNTSSLTRCSPSPAGVVCPCCPTKLLASNFRTQTTIEPIQPALRLAPPPIPQVFLITATPLNLHKRFLTGSFLQTAVSDAPRMPPEIDLQLTTGRIRYSTGVSGSPQNQDFAANVGRS
jgi:hypothetical protein